MSNDGVRPELFYSTATVAFYERIENKSKLAKYLVSPMWSLVKRLIDFTAALLLLVVLSPFLFIIGALVGLSGRPILFRHERVGRNGGTFGCYKFRSMVPNAQQVLTKLLAEDPLLRAEWERDHKLRNDPRVTWIGSFLRRTSFDELPQLLNVLLGHMSLIGPRPIVQEELDRYGRAARWYLAVRPGMTGLWQVSGRNDTDYRRRVALDAYYVRSQSVMLDLTILLLTVRVVFGGRGAY